MFYSLEVNNPVKVPIIIQREWVWPNNTGYEGPLHRVIGVSTSTGAVFLIHFFFGHEVNQILVC